MKIAYLVFGNFSKEDGVSKKIIGQIEEWQENGCEVKLFCVTDQKNINGLFFKKGAVNIYTAHYSLLAANPFKLKVLKEWKPDVIYFRHFPFSLSLYLLMKKYPTVIEINSDDVNESKLTFNRVTRLYHLLTRDLILGMSKGIITVTKELQEKFSSCSSKIMTISNGFDFSKVEGIQNRKCSNEVNVVFIGSPNQAWHGVEKIVYLAEKCPDYNFHIIGPKIENYKLPNIIEHGYLEQRHYVNILVKANIAIGSLALHRNNMEEASPLKVREYLAFGIPVIIGYKDTDFLDIDAPFILKLPNTANNISSNIQEIISFIEKYKTYKVPYDSIKQIDKTLKEQQRITFFRDVIRSK